MGFTGTGDVIEVIRTEATEFAWDNQRAGEAIVTYDIIFRDGDFWKKGDARNPDKARPPIGMAQDTATSGLLLDVWIRGLVSNGAWSGLLTSGNRVFLASGGGLTMTPPALSGDTVIEMGRAVTLTAMELNPDARIVRVGQ